MQKAIEITLSSVDVIKSTFNYVLAKIDYIRYKAISDTKYYIKEFLRLEDNVCHRCGYVWIAYLVSMIAFAFLFMLK